MREIEANVAYRWFLGLRLTDKVRDGKPKGFFYLDHRTVHARHAIITDSHVTAGNVHDSIPYLGRLDRQRERFGLDVRAVGPDRVIRAICRLVRAIINTGPQKRHSPPEILQKQNPAKFRRGLSAV